MCRDNYTALSGSSEIDCSKMTCVAIPESTVSGFDNSSYHLNEESLRRILQSTTISIISVGIVVTNLVNLVVLSHARDIPKVTKSFLVSLSSSDLMVGAIACAPSIVSTVVGCWPYSAVWCQISGIAHGASVTISIWSISMVGIDRYVAVLLPLRYRRLISLTKCYAVITGQWILALVTFSAPLLTKSDLLYYKYNSVTKLCGLQWDYPAFCIITGIYIPILSAVILIFTSFRINTKLKEHAIVRKTRRTNAFKANRRSYKILVATSVAYFAFWGPYVISAYVQSFVPSLKLGPVLEFMFIWLANSNSLVNVVIYNLSSPVYRRTSRNLICRGVRWCGCDCIIDADAALDRLPTSQHLRVNSVDDGRGGMSAAVLCAEHEPEGNFSQESNVWQVMNPFPVPPQLSLIRETQEHGRQYLSPVSEHLVITDTAADHSASPACEVSCNVIAR